MNLKIEKFLIDLSQNKNISVSEENGKLKINASKDLITEEIVKEIRLRKEEILEFLKAKRQRESSSITLAKDKTLYNLSSIQKRLFFLQEFDKGTVAYNLPKMLLIKGDLHIGKLSEAITKLVERHEILRTSFVIQEGEVYQKINDEINISIEFEKCEKGRVNSEIDKFISPFDLSQDNLFRAKVLEIEENEYLLMTDIHHIISDGISQGIFIDEFMAFYNGSELPKLKIQYKDYSEWQQNEDHKKEIAKSKEFWLNEFNDATETLELKLDYPRKVQKEYLSESVNFLFNTQETKKLKELAQQEGTTLFMLFLSIYYILLNKLTGQNNITIGTISSGRQKEELVNLIGAFVNTLPIRNDIDNCLSFTDFLGKVKNKVVSCFDNQEYYYDDLVHDLRIERDTSRNPLFDVLFTFHNYEQNELKIPGLEVSSYEDNFDKTAFDIELTGLEFNNEIAMKFICVKSLFRKDTVNRFVSYFKKIALSVINNNEVKLADINILSSEEERKIKNDFNDTNQFYPKEENIISLFEKQVSKTPNNVALIYQDTKVSYKELQNRMDRIANYLREIKGIKSGDLVGILMEREENLIPLIYGIMKSGAAYIPISPNYPKERVKTIIEDSGLKLIISRNQFFKDISIASELLDMDEEWSKIESFPVKHLSGIVSSQDLAYVIYTSGSTGKPKGVMIEHHSVVNRILWMQKQYPIAEEDVLLQKTPIVFDVSVWELFWWAMQGSSLSLLKPNEEREPDSIIRAIKKNKVTTIHFVPSMLSTFQRVVISEGRFDELKSLKQVFASGEALSSEQVTLFQKNLHRNCGIRLINLYGPTEATVDVSSFECDFSKEYRIIPIGKPIDNIRLYIIDTNNSLAPVGVKGELCIAGAGLARGYLNDKEKTNEKFIKVDGIDEERIYRTGDIACWMTDGNIEFIGRNDFQVKIRGFRIELGEIESTLMMHKDIQKAVVLAKEKEGSKYLVAYYVASTEIEVSSIKSFLKDKLPEYMVPVHYVFLNTIPLTENGKINLKALPEPKIVSNTSYIAPRNAIEKGMVRIWSEVLKLNKIGVKDDFFALGGDSLLAIKLLYEINKHFKCSVRLSQLYSNSSVEGLSNSVLGSEGEDVEFENIEKELSAFEQEYREINTTLSTQDKVYPMSMVEKGMVFYSLLKDENETSFHNILYHEQNVYPITFNNFNYDLFKYTVQLMTNKHDTLRKVYDVDHFAHIIKSNIEPELYFIDISHLSTNEQEDFYLKILEEERLRASGFAGENLWRMNVLKLKSNYHLVVFDMHHSVLDGWSLHALITEMNNTYIELERNQNYLPEQLACSYRDCIIGELKDARNEESLEYWKNELSGYNRLQLAETGEEHKYETEFFELGNDFKKELKAIAASLNTNLKHLCFGAFVHTMRLLSGSEDFTVGIASNNRPLVEDSDKLLGCFINMLPFRANIPDNLSAIEYISRVEEKLRKMKAYERVPFYNILDCIGERLGEGNPVFDIAYNFIDFWVIKDLNREMDTDIDIRDFKHDNNDVNQNTLFDFHVRSTIDEFRIGMEYSTTIMNPSLTKRIFNAFKSFLIQLIENVKSSTFDNKLSDITLLLEDEEKQLLYEFNETTTVYPKYNSVIELFDKQVNNVPDKIAIQIGDKDYSFKELQILSYKIAAYIRTSASWEEKCLVPIILDREEYLIPAILGVIAAGGIYVPIEPQSPVSRVNSILENSDVKLLISRSSFLNNSYEEKVSHIINLDECIDEILDKDEITPYSVKDSDIAYIIYTSGTTGIPKGAMISHGALLNYLNWASDEYIRNENCPMSLFTSIAFDLTVTSIFLPLVNGNTLRLYSSQDHEVLIEQVFSEGHANVVKLTPSHLRLLLTTNSSFSGIKRLILGGEQLEDELAYQVYQKSNGSIEIYNEYGPTEATVGCILYKYNPEDHQSRNSVLIGKPVANTKIYILDEQLRPVPIGLQGEIYIGGAQLFNGYVSEEVQTKAVLIDNPFIPEEKLYKTGDLARWISNGNIEFIGRKDNQIKLNGYRIELGDIENAINSIPEINQCFVILKERKTESGVNKYLVAYYTIHKQGELSEDYSSESEIKFLSKEDIIKSLSHLLPDYMLPSLLVELESFPLTINGKIDKKALPEQDTNAMEQYVAPSNELEERLLKIWVDILGANEDKIGVNVNFFEKGGDSIKSIQLASKIRQLGYLLTIKEINENPTIKKLSNILKVKTKEKQVDQKAVEGAVNLLPIQRWFFTNNYEEPQHYNQALILNFPTGISKGDVHEIFTKIQIHHDALRMTFNYQEGEVEQNNQGTSASLYIEERDVSNKTEEEKQVLYNKLQSSIDLSQGPLMKLGLYHVDNESNLLIVIHHLVIDGVSWRILLEDIETLYNQKTKGMKPTLPLKTDSYQTWSEKIQQYIKGPEYEKSKKYWDKFIAKLPVINTSENKAEDNLIGLSEYESLSLNKKDTAELQEANKAYGTTIEDLLLSALFLSFEREFKANQLLVDIEGHGREDIIKGIDISRTVGWFTSIYPVFLENEKGNYKKTIINVKEAIRKTPHKGFDYLLYKDMELCDINSDTEVNSRLCFNYLGQVDQNTSNKSFSIADEHGGNLRSLKNKRDYEFEVSGIISNGSLQVNFSYNRELNEQIQIKRLIDSYKTILFDLIAHCKKQMEFGKCLTPSDLTFQDVSVPELNELQKEYPIQDIYTLSPMQEGMYYNYQLDTKSIEYFEQISYEIKGDFDLEKAKYSLNDLVARHDVLRTIFTDKIGSQNLQIVLKQRDVDFSYINVQDEVSNEGLQRVINNYKEKDKERRFNLNKDSLIRITILQTGKSDFTFIWSFHHIIMDGWCLSILINDYTQFYKSRLNNKEAKLPEIEPYCNYIKWLTNKSTEGTRKYWSNYIQGYESKTGIPKRTNFPSIISTIGEEGMSLKDEIFSSLTKHSRENGITLNSVIQTAWSILLMKYNNTNDIVFGSVVSGRSSEVAGIEQMVGLFINTIPVRAINEGSTSFFDMANKIQSEYVDGALHHHLSLPEIQSLSINKRELFDHIILFENYPIANEVEGAVAKEKSLPYEVSNVQMFEQTNYDLVLTVIPLDDQVKLKFDYNTEIYDSSTINMVKGHLETIFKQLAIKKDILVNEIDILTEKETCQILHEFNNTYKQYPDEKTIVDLFEEQVRKTPNEIAVQFNGEEMTYLELNSKSNQLARYLLASGVYPEEIIGIFVERGIEMIISIFAVLKAGCSYLPIDADFPVDRIISMLEDSKAKMILTSSILKTLYDQFPQDIEVTNLDIININNEDSSNLELDFSSNSLCYVIYTSGSTGKPKGIMIEHKSVVNFAYGVLEKIDFQDLSSILCLTTISFDIFVLETFLPLLNGKKVVLASSTELYDISRLTTLIKKSKLDTLQVTPSRLQMLLQTEGEDIFKGVKLIMVGGEPLSENTLRSLKTVYQGEIYNMYGPTETTVWSAIRDLTNSEYIDIGKPIINTGIYIVDQNAKLQPIGAVGELCIDGDGMARGYLNNKKLTDEKFIKHPFKKNGRLYKTGDLAKWLPDGNIEFLCRIDNQVKIRGFRIELGEIENRILEHNHIVDAIVAVKGEDDNKYLVLYYLSNEELKTDELKAFLSKSLPGYMVPSFFVKLDDFPKTFNGKLDRNKLPDPNVLENDIVLPPTNEIESTLVEFWSVFLKIDKSYVCINKSFFELGGHSIIALSMLNKVNKHFGVNITLAELLQADNIKNLSDIISVRCPNEGDYDDNYDVVTMKL